MENFRSRSTVDSPRLHLDFSREHPHFRQLLRNLSSRSKEVERDPTGARVLGVDLSQSYTVSYTAFRSVMLYQKWGQEVVVVGPRMQASFARTDLSRVAPTDFRLPYPCFYLATPGSKMEIWGGPDTRWHPIEGAYVYWEPTRPGELMVLVWGGPNAASASQYDDAMFFFSLNMEELVGLAGLNLEQRVEELSGFLQGPLENIHADASLARRLHGLDGAVQSVLERGVDCSDEGQQVPAEVTGKMMENLHEFFRVLVSTCLYLTNPRSDRETREPSPEREELAGKIARLRKRKHPDARRLQEQLDRLPAHRTVWVGPEIEKAVGAATDLTSSGPGGGQAPAGHYRRGHMHPYLTGPRKDATGAPIPSVERGVVYHWNAAVWVGKKDKQAREADRGARVYRVEDPAPEDHSSVGAGAAVST